MGWYDHLIVIIIIFFFGCWTEVADLFVGCLGPYHAVASDCA